MGAKRNPVRERLEEESQLRIFVRRGALRRYDRLKREAAELPVSVEWDRRTTERRKSTVATPERRKSDRRQSPPFTWTTADFVIVEDLSQPQPRPARSRTRRK